MVHIDEIYNSIAVSQFCARDPVLNMTLIFFKASLETKLSVLIAGKKKGF